MSDIKNSTITAGIPQDFEPDTLAWNNYYAFGMLQPGRNGNSPSYRYGFNGMEKDDEVKGSGNSYDFGARIYDPRLGRWLSRDPLASRYPSFSPYAYTVNNPIVFIDPDGEDVILSKSFRKNFLGVFRIFKRSKMARSMMNQFATHHSGDFKLSNNQKTYKMSRHTLEFHDSGDLVTNKVGGGLTRIFVKTADGEWELYDDFEGEINKETEFKVQMSIVSDGDGSDGYMATILNHEAFLWGNVYASWLNSWEEGNMSTEQLKYNIEHLAISRRYGGITDLDSDIQKAHRQTLVAMTEEALKQSDRGELQKMAKNIKSYMTAREDEIDSMGRKNSTNWKADEALEAVRKEHTDIMKKLKRHNVVLQTKESKKKK